MFNRKENLYTDPAREMRLPNDMSWVNQIDGTDIHRNVYNEIASRISITDYLSLGSGLGRQIVLAWEAFQGLRRVVSVDLDTRGLHPSLYTLPITLEEYKGITIVQAIEDFARRRDTFDLCIVENVPHHGIFTSRHIDDLAQIIQPAGLLGFLSDCTPPYQELRRHSNFSDLNRSLHGASPIRLFQRV